MTFEIRQSIERALQTLDRDRCSGVTIAVDGLNVGQSVLEAKTEDLIAEIAGGTK